MMLFRGSSSTSFIAFQSSVLAYNLVFSDLGCTYLNDCSGWASFAFLDDSITYLLPHTSTDASNEAVALFGTSLFRYELIVVLPP
ncbi:hypothetical protein H5410_023506 [Solanum commersonii]|uniref:Uncharacterized protein n=1 Tax=Solanum commersonii TaxID=4109 RepID=A0A9J5ZH19_SOLCO|nr:hypothetical protein H5410_023506 [Solanum commersonii]